MEVKGAAGQRTLFKITVTRNEITFKRQENKCGRGDINISGLIRFANVISFIRCYDFTPFNKN